MSRPEFHKGVHGCMRLHSHVVCKCHTYSTHMCTHSSRRDGREGKDRVLGDAMTNVILNCGETEKYLGLWLLAFALYH